MILTDTGPIAAIAHNDDRHQLRCSSFVNAYPGVLITPEACFVEAMHLLHRAGGYALQAALWKFGSNGGLLIRESFQVEYDRREVLMAKYADTPTDLADAAVVAAAESLGTNTVFTIDPHFNAYRTATGKRFVVIPTQ